MIKLENRCANCGGKFGLVYHNHFCRKACRDDFLAKTANDHARMRKWFGRAASSKERTRPICRQPAQAETEAKSSCNDTKSSTSGRKLIFTYLSHHGEAFVGPGRTRASFCQQSRRRSPPLLRYLHRSSSTADLRRNIHTGEHVRLAGRQTDLHPVLGQMGGSATITFPKALRGETKPDLLAMAEIERLKTRIAELEAGLETRRHKRKLRYTVPCYDRAEYELGVSGKAGNVQRGEPR
jgi:hypothetical protein